MIEKTVQVVIMLAVGALIAYMVVSFDRLHVDGKKHCDELHGVWLDRELKCIEGKELK